MPDHPEINEIIRKRIEGLSDNSGMKEFLYFILEHELEIINMGTTRYSDEYLRMAQKLNQDGKG